MTRSRFAGVVFAVLVSLAFFCALPAEQVQEADPYAAILTYEYGQSRRAQTTIEREIREANAEQLKKIEAKLLKALQSPKATIECKRFVCRKLRLIGGDESVAPLAALLRDKELSHMARFALQSMASPKADEALLKGLGKVEGELKVGIIGTIGIRGDRKAVPALGKLTTDENGAVALAAIKALGHIGTGEAAEALRKAEVKKKFQGPLENARLLCAERMLTAGQLVEARVIYHELFQDGADAVIRVAALRGILVSEESGGIPALLGAVLKDEDAAVRKAAGKLIAEFGGTETTQVIAAELHSLSPDEQVIVLSALAARGDGAALPGVLKAVNHPQQPVRLAAITAAGALGDASIIDKLLAASSAGDEELKAGRAALAALRDRNVDSELIKRIDKAEPNKAKLMIGVLMDRNAAEAKPMLLAVAGKSRHRNVRGEAFKALRSLAGPDDLPQLVNLLVKSDPSLHNAAAATIFAVASLMKDREERVAPLISAMGESGNEAKCALLVALGKLGGPTALEAVRDAWSDGEIKVKDAALRAMANWPDAATAEDLLKIAQGETGETKLQQILALRGYIRAAGLLGPDANRKLSMLKKAAALAKRPEEKKQLLGALGQLPSREALEAARAYLDDAALRPEAAAAVLKIGSKLCTTEPEIIKELCHRIKKMSISEGISKQADELLTLVRNTSSYVHSWQVAGPYEKRGKDATQLLAVNFAPEKDSGAKAEWQTKNFSVIKDKPWLADLLEFFHGKNKVVYLRATVHSDKGRQAVLELGSDDGVKVWLNGQLVHENNVIRPTKPGEDKVNVKLHKGANTLMLKLTQAGGGWAVAVRFTDQQGNAIPEVEVRAGV
ncbi:MAG: HEAT repeat domain-containing protein [Planctomycetota bacterium]|jgi:HEAT repeat protein